MLNKDLRGEVNVKPHLVAYEYGSGAAWGYVLAPSPAEVEKALPEVEVFEAPPSWMTADDIDGLKNFTTVNVKDVSIDALLQGKKVQAQAIGR